MTLEIDKDGNLYCGINLDLNYKDGILDTNMIIYITNDL